MFIALGVGLSGAKWRWVRSALLTGFMIRHVMLLWRFVNFRWAG
jgi:hypothetical protein